MSNTIVFTPYLKTLIQMFLNMQIRKQQPDIANASIIT